MVKMRKGLLTALLVVVSLMASAGVASAFTRFPECGDCQENAPYCIGIYNMSTAYVGGGNNYVGASDDIFVYGIALKAELDKVDDKDHPQSVDDARTNWVITSPNYEIIKTASYIYLLLVVRFL